MQNPLFLGHKAVKIPKNKHLIMKVATTTTKIVFWILTIIMQFYKECEIFGVGNRIK